MATTKVFGVDYPAAAALDGTETLSIQQAGAMVDTNTGDIAALAAAGAVAGADKDVQFNDGGVFGAESAFQYDKATNVLAVGNINIAVNGLLAAAASVAANSGFRIPHGVAPTSPANGDVWTTTAGLYARINGATVGPYAVAGAVSDGDKGDLTVTVGGTVWTIDAGVVTLAKLANIAANSIIGNNTGSPATPIELTGANVAVMTQGAGLDVDATGFRGIPVNDQSGNYTCVASDNGKMVRHPSGAGAGDTFTIPANASVAYEIGAAITFVNLDSNSVSIAIATDTLRWSPAGTTGTRALAQYGEATAVKVDTALWLISGPGLS